MSGIGNIPTYYINKRSYNDGIWTVECLDRCAFLDQVIDTAPNDQPWAKNSNGEYLTSAFTAALRSQCGFGSVSIPYTKATIPSSRIDGKTYQTVLSEMSVAYCGFFCCLSTNTLTWVPFRHSTSSETIAHYSRIHDNGDYAYASVHVSDGTNENKYGSGLPRLEISNEYAVTADSEQPSDIYLPITRTTFKGWSVDNAVSALATLPSAGGTLTFGSAAYRVTRVDAHIAGGVLMMSVGGDIPQTGEINRRGLMQQKLDDAVSTTKTYKTVTFNPYQGPMLVPNTEG